MAVETRENLLGKYREIVLARGNHTSKQPAKDDPKYQGWSERAEKWDATFVAWQEQWRDRQVHTLAELSGWLEDTIAIKARKWKNWLNDPDIEPSDIATETINWIDNKATELGAMVPDVFAGQQLTPREAMGIFRKLLKAVKQAAVAARQIESQQEQLTSCQPNTKPSDQNFVQNAIAVLAVHRDWSLSRIAKEIGINKGTLYRSEFLNIHKQYRSEERNGSKIPTGYIDKKSGSIVSITEEGEEE